MGCAAFPSAAQVREGKIFDWCLSCSRQLKSWLKSWLKTWKLRAALANACNVSLPQLPLAMDMLGLGKWDLNGHEGR